MSWYESEPARSLEWIQLVAPEHDSAIVDIGAGTSRLADRLVAEGYTDVTILDVSSAALEEVGTRLGQDAGRVSFVLGDVLQWRPSRTYDVWHDRAVFHFLVDPEERTGYVAVLRAALRRGGHLVMATFAPSGPDHCSGLPTMRYDADALVAAIGPGFAVVRTLAADHVTPAGDRQPFTWVTLRREG